MTWVQGKSGNPGALRAGAISEAKRVAMRILELTDNGDEMIKRLCEIAGIGPGADKAMRTNSPAEQRNALTALTLLLDRVWGKAPQEINLSIGVHADQGRFAPLSTETLAELAGVAVLDALPAALDDAKDGNVDPDGLEDDEPDDELDAEEEEHEE